MGGYISKSNLSSMKGLGEIFKSGAIRDLKKGIKEGAWHEIKRRTGNTLRGSPSKRNKNRSSQGNNQKNTAALRNETGSAGVSSGQGNNRKNTAALGNETGNVVISSGQSNNRKNTAALGNGTGNVVISSGQSNNRKNKNLNGGSRKKYKKSNS